MMSSQQNERLTRIGQGTAAGTLMRMYWQPAALVDELPDDRPVKAVRLLGQDLVLFRDDAGRYGLLDRDCPHRGADLAYGRLEDGGLRCLFHGWLFDVDGACRETPAEPEGSTLCRHVRQRSYPVQERGGIVFAYLGTGTPPAFPDFDCFVAPASHTFAFKGFLECNWLQALEVGIDPAHASYLHRFFEDADPSANYGRQFRGTSASSDVPMTKVLREFSRPTIDVERADYGMRLVARRRIDEDRMHVRITNLVFPHAFVIPLSASITITQWHVPVDDVSCYWYAIFTSFAEAMDK
jgi:phthalate 4,5-dioxygenase